MPRKKKQQVKVNNSASLEGLMQEVYNDACSQINDAQKTINVLTTSTTPEDVEDASKIAKSKTDAQKVKDSAIKIKLEVAKLQSDIIKHSGNVDKAVDDRSDGKANLEDFKSIRQMLSEDKDIQDNNDQTNN
jgi:hypothetical protein